MESSYFLDRQACSRHTIFPGVDILTAAGKDMMISLVEMQPGAVVELHQHPHEQMGMLLEGELEFTVGSEKKTLHAGDIWRIPGEIAHTCRAGSSGAKAIDIFHPIREDYL